MSNSINKRFQKVSDTIEDLIITYLRFMGTIGNSIVAFNKDVEINKRKLSKPKKSFIIFSQAQNVFELSKLIFKTENQEWPQTVDVESFENFIKLDDYMKYISEKTKIEQTYPNTVFGFCVSILFYDEDIEKSFVKQHI